MMPAPGSESMGIHPNHRRRAQAARLLATSLSRQH
jgi:hypothetical protein